MSDAERGIISSIRDTSRAAVSSGRITQAYVDFRVAVIEASLPSDAGIGLPARLSDAASVEECLRSGVPLLACDGPVRAPEGLTETARDIAGLMARFGVDGACDLEESLSTPLASAAAASAAESLFARDRAAFESAADKMAAPSPLLRFALTASSGAFFGTTASRAAPLIRQDLWMRGYCPACGLEPVAAKFVREPPGARIMRCSGCRTEWRAKRVTCPFCGNSETGTLKVLASDFGSAERVSACESCRRYVKEIDERKLVEGIAADLTAFDVVSLDLDLEAERAGYVKP